MMLKLFITILFSTTFLFSSVDISGNSMKITTKSGFKTKANIHKVLGSNEKNKTFILLHGKSSKPDKVHYEELIKKLNKNGFKVIAPQMPWGKHWKGTFTQGLEVIDEISKSIVDRGHKAILLGHSLGAASSLIYAAKNEKNLVSAIVTIAPGHMIHLTKKMQKVTKKSVQRAREKVAEGNGDRVYKFKEQNTGKTKDVKMSANIYLSYYDLELFPNVKELLEEVEMPVLWISGKEDRMTKVYRMDELFEWLGDNDKNSYKLLKGKHKSVLKHSSDEITKWTDNL